MSTTHPVEPRPIQPRDSFKCPSWCVRNHDDRDLAEWEYGQWTVTHESPPKTWPTSRGTWMTATLRWSEIVGSSPILPGDGFGEEGPYIEFGGDDGSSYSGAHEVDAKDIARWVDVLEELAREVSA